MNKYKPRMMKELHISRMINYQQNNTSKLKESSYLWYYGESRKLDFFICIVFLSIVLFVTGYLHKLLYTEALIDTILTEGIDYDAFREFKVNRTVINKCDERIRTLIKNNPQLEGLPFIDRYGIIAFSMMAFDYDLIDADIIDNDTFIRGIGRVAANPGFKELYGNYKAILMGTRYFPVPKLISGDADVSFDNSWFVLRRYGGNRRHEGTDIMASNNLRGYFPVISMTDGVVENIGWLEKGGKRIGIRSETGGYYYYAHLDSYAPDIDKGASVLAGQLIGFMGDSGYGTEGTIGMFDVHLHLGIYVKNGGRDMSINPYFLLKLLEANRNVLKLAADDKLITVNK